MIDVDLRVLVQHPDRLALGVNVLQELLVQAGLFEGDLPSVIVDVEGPALLSGIGGLVELVDGDRNPVHLQDARADQTGQTRSHDGDGRC